MDATLEGYGLLKKMGYPILPYGDETYFKPGVKRDLMKILLDIMAKTALGRLAATDHCRSAAAEIEQLNTAFGQLRMQLQPNFPMPVWDKLQSEMPSWESVKEQYGNR